MHRVRHHLKRFPQEMYRMKMFLVKNWVHSQYHAGHTEIDSKTLLQKKLN